MTALRSGPGFVVLREVGKDRWEFLGEVQRRRGLTARDARAQAILEATKGTAKAGETYAAVLRSEWRVALDWELPSEQIKRQTTRAPRPSRRPDPFRPAP